MPIGTSDHSSAEFNITVAPYQQNSVSPPTVVNTFKWLPG